MTTSLNVELNVHAGVKKNNLDKKKKVTVEDQQSR